MDYILECLDKFEELPASYKDVFGSQETQDILFKLENKFKVELSFLLILLAISELYPDDINEYLEKKYKLGANQIDIIKTEIEDKVLNKAKKIYNQIEAARQEEIINNKEVILSVFTGHLLTVFKMSTANIRNLNIITFSLFNEDPLLEDRAINALYNNQELISKNFIYLEDKKVKASIANFLKDFIQKYGSEMPDNLILANYLNSSSNVKILNSQEKNILNRVLKTYRNIVFFPESMERIAMEKWELIASSDKDVVEVDDALVDEKIDSLKKAQSLIKSTEKEEFSEEDKEKKGEQTRLEDLSFKDLDELNQMLRDYPLNSLEYKAVREEINHIKKRQKKQ